MREKNFFYKIIVLLLIFLGIICCSSKPVIMTSKDVKISREDPSKDCKELGLIRGRTTTAKGTVEEAIEDLKKEASQKGANYIKMQSTGGNTNDVTGFAFDCP